MVLFESSHSHVQIGHQQLNLVLILLFMQDIKVLEAPSQPAMQQIRVMTSDGLLDRLRAWSEEPEPRRWLIWTATQSSPTLPQALMAMPYG